MFVIFLLARNQLKSISEKLPQGLEKMLKKNAINVLFLTSIMSLFACSTPEEEAKDRQTKGIQLFDKGDYDKAELELKSAIQQDKEGADSYYYLALLNEKRRNFKAMKENLIQAIKLNPQNVEAKIKLGKVHLLFDESAETMKIVDEILANTPDSEDALSLKAAALVRDNKLADAMTVLDNVLAKNSKHNEALSLKAVLLMENESFDEALALLEPAISEDKNNLSLHLLKIKLDSRKNDIDAVIADYLELINVFPEKDDLKYALAKIYVLAKKNDLAEKLLTDLVESKPGQIKPKLVALGFYNALDKAKTDEKLRLYIEQAKGKPDMLMALARWTLAANRIEDAKSQLRAIVSSDDINDELKSTASLMLAQIDFQQRDYANSLASVESILKGKPNFVEAKILKAKLLLESEKLDEASTLLNSVLWDMPNSDETIVLLGQIALLQGDRTKGEKYFKDALDINPTNLQALFPVVDKALREKHNNFAKEVLNKALARMPGELVLINKLIQIHMIEKDWIAAENLLQQLQKQPKANQLAQFLQAKLYQEKGECSQAVPLFKGILEKSPVQTDTLTELARCYELLKQRPKMVSFLTEILGKYPDNLPAIILKSKLLSLDKNFDGAVSLLKMSLENSPNSVSLIAELGRIYNLKGMVNEATEIYQKGVSDNPDNLQLSMLLASNYVNQKKYDEAAKIYEYVLEKNPRLDVARNNLASMLLDYQSGPESIDKALKLVDRFKYSDQPYFMDTYAWAEFKAGRLNQALTILEKVIVASPNTPIFRYHLAEVYNALGNKTGAISELRQALAIAQTHDFEQLDSAQALLNKLQNEVKAKQ
ncbi:tetratricopeptide repeat protein [Methylicorpusculum sp.]|uniref:tetratricopeptide repeat protein n=1 Tax=Methylicorpusculum sp. TaxID=2713644 RepID=UPI002722863F|nr:tetratricopeptide repeat protein [Methylicorpusculum sp.]MDO8846000.1 tetratricopeptide repeat protein [Methylicorpusculum sp.]